LETLQKGTLDKTQYKLYSHISVQALCYYGQVLRHQGNFDEAVRLFERCLKQFEINDIDLLGKIYLECGMNSIQSLKLLKGLDFYHKALAAYEKVNWKLDIAKVLNSIA
jgi:tetratricopeptide (TPR) repeat protein